MSENKAGLGLFDPESWSAGGFQGGRAKILQARMQMIAPNPQEPRAPHVVFKLRTAGGEETEQRWGLGKNAHTRFKITEGGKKFVGVGGATINRGCKAALLIKSLIDSDFEFESKPKSATESPDLSELDGVVAEFESVPMEVGDKIKAERKASGKGDLTCLVVKSIVGSEDGGSEEAAEEAASPEGGEVDQEALVAAFKEHLVEIVGADKITVTELKKAALKAVEGDENLKEFSDDLMAALEDEEMIGQLGFEVEDGKDAKGKKARVVSNPEAEAPAQAPKKKGLFGKK